MMPTSVDVGISRSSNDRVANISNGSFAALSSRRYIMCSLGRPCPFIGRGTTSS